MSKKVLAVILSLILAFSVVAVPVGAADISFDSINLEDINLENFNAENFFNLWCLWYFRGSQSVCFWGFGNFGNYVIEKITHSLIPPMANEGEALLKN